jgi:dethiobiotin synthetase
MSLHLKKTGLFVAGTDTGVGKTVLSAGLVGLAREFGLRSRAIKPIETGCREIDGRLVPEDGEFLLKAAPGELTLNEIVPYRFRLPASPARAALSEGKDIFVSDLLELIKDAADKADFTLVEGAGGLMVPIRENYMMIDLVESLGYPVALVAKTRLGTINHTLLSLEALAERRISVSAVVLSKASGDTGPEEVFTPEDIGNIVPDIPVLVLPHLDEETVNNPAKIARALADSWNREDILRLIPVDDEVNHE